MVLVGDEPYYGKAGFKRIAKGQVTMPGPVDPARLLIAELAPGAFDGVTGAIRPDWTRLICLARAAAGAKVGTANPAQRECPMKRY